MKTHCYAVIVLLLQLPTLSFAQDASLPANDSEIFTVVDESAVPEGGMSKFYECIGRNVRMPTQARQKGVDGKVFVQFIVEKDGTVSDIRTIRGMGLGCDEEAERVVRLCADWKPGKIGGKPVRQRMVFPIRFRFHAGQDKKSSR
jgi:protein TonB